MKQVASNCCLTLKMEVWHVPLNQIILEDRTLHKQHCENLKSYIHVVTLQEIWEGQDSGYAFSFWAALYFVYIFYFAHAHIQPFQNISLNVWGWRLKAPESLVLWCLPMHCRLYLRFHMFTYFFSDAFAFCYSLNVNIYLLKWNLKLVTMEVFSQIQKSMKWTLRQTHDVHRQAANLIMSQRGVQYSWN
jgi:hypothetical protein